MREIKFRGKSVENNKWVYGSYISRGHHNYLYDLIIDYKSNKKAVIPETAGQYTGKKDKNEQEIYEDDIVKTKLFGDAGYDTETFIGVVKFDKVRSEYRVINDEGYQTLGYNEWEKLGNKHENPELLG